MREAFAHNATVKLVPGGERGAPGAAITVELCGHWEHEGPCPLAPHYTSAEPVGDELRLRTLFVVEPELEHRVRERIEAALRGRWELTGSESSEVAESELEHAQRLMRS